ncbi:hypothetical protein [Kingella potus]|uniref:hypothetical protein n=1 Tax=Kingella potus TaxID=265175 RepID=UPI001FD0CC7B|nr:hypothetical protein [Kingella potus]UOP01495.1 hypothetical protein LVJ84_04705 [Kingella potus]
MRTDAANDEYELAEFDPRLFANGIYRLRLRATDLAGRSSEIYARIMADSADKAAVQSASDAVFRLGSRTFALDRILQTGGGYDFGNWSLAGLDTRLSHDQDRTDSQGLPAAWHDGAVVWLAMPSVSGQAAPEQGQLRFTLNAQADDTGRLKAVFGSDNGWTLAAGDTALQRQGKRLHHADNGLPWLPERYTLTDPHGTQYSLDGHGRVEAVRFADGGQWLVSDAGIALVGDSLHRRIGFVRDSRGA